MGLSRERRTLTRLARGAEGARPVITRHGSYQGVLCGGGREWGAECAMVGGGKQVMVGWVLFWDCKVYVLGSWKYKGLFWDRALFRIMIDAI